ncbi:uncharacterized protein BXZ73DRAFT_106169 [Epithele typhae]|uniref:uncharacterized protein n=1 Tax=Epithele typhae TaxID=378194 RepID=UPI002007AB77|nr:uncharacterized protein BXZ73DRAFT_106169 [Epithele typhae]KAH9915440.1 hypothetical protein BXZ73DRAFT_106169 [Epithele typhae]
MAPTSIYHECNQIMPGVLRAHRAALTYLEFRDHTEMGPRDDEHEDGASGSASPVSATSFSRAARTTSRLSDADHLPPHPNLAFVDVWVSTPRRALAYRPHARLDVQYI